MTSPQCEPISEICKITEALSVISGKWKPTILIHLRFGGTHRFNELRRLMPNVTQKMLTAQLRELEHDGLIVRTVYPQVPPRVEYSLSEYGKTLDTILCSMHRWGGHHMARRQSLQHTGAGT